MPNRKEALPLRESTSRSYGAERRNTHNAFGCFPVVLQKLIQLIFYVFTGGYLQSKSLFFASEDLINGRNSEYYIIFLFKLKYQKKFVASDC
jgi:hypothetical protein